MNYARHTLEDLGVTAETACFAPCGGVAEWHVMLHVAPRGEMFADQLQRLYAAQERLLTLPGMEGARCVMKRYFLSDSTNQQPLMRRESGVAVSVIQQQPLDGSKVAVWMYLQRGMEMTEEHGMVVLRHNGYQHLWKMGMCCHESEDARHTESSAWQTEKLLKDYEEGLSHFQATLADHCLRTWFFVRDVDTQYMGMVRARRDNFTQQGLTSQTHYISSTGIGGLPADTRSLIQLGAYALTGFAPSQQRYLYAPTHLNPTYEYGVTFERGTLMQYGDRDHVIISGTASINNKGEVLHVGDIVQQTNRMWENVEKLLEEGGCDFSDVMHVIVYLRDTADYDIVSRLFAERFPHIPTVITLAPVCRPTWLIEMECMAVKAARHEEFREY